MPVPKSFLLRGTALSTVAIFLIGASEGNAAETMWIKLGGYSTQYLGYASQNNLDPGDFTGPDIKSDTEIFFVGDTTLDNGLSIGVNVQLEGNTSSDQIH